MIDDFQSQGGSSDDALSQNSETVSEDDVLITPTLGDRPTRQPDLATENQALHTLAQQLLDEPQSMLKTLVNITKDLCQTETAGVSLLETLSDGTSVFRRVAIAGPLSYLEQTAVPSDFSPCGTTIRLGQPQLYAYPERFFKYLHHPQFPIVEALLLPLCTNHHALGTLWIFSHSEQRHFDCEDQRLMTSLASFTAAALQNLRSEHARRQAESHADFLVAIGQDLLRATTVAEIVETVGCHLSRYLNASACALVEVNSEYDEAVIQYDWHQEDVPGLVGVYFLPEFVSPEFLQVARAGQTIVVRDTTNDLYIDDPQKFSALKIRSLINIPFTKDNTWRFTLGIYHQTPYHWRTDEIDLINELSAQIWSKIERVKAEEALRQSEARFRLMIESAKEYAIFTLDLDNNITAWNSGAERLLGYRESEIVGRSGRIIFTPEDVEQGKADRELEAALTQGQAENERWHVRKDQSRFWGSGLVMPLQNEAGQVQGLVKILQDKTAQRQADQRFHLLYDTTSDLLATEQPLELMHNLFEKLSGQLGLHCYYNYMVEEREGCPMLHLKSYEGISEATAKTIEWIEFGSLLCGIVAQTQQQLVLDQTQIATHPNATFIASLGITAYACQPLISQGRFLGSLSFGSFTRTHFTAEEIDLLQSTCDQIAIAIDRAELIDSIQQQTKQLQQTNRIKDEFLAVLSHELRSPLNPILGWSRLLQHSKLDEARTAQALATIERNAKLQSQLIEDLLDVSRILRGNLNLVVTPVNLAATIRAAIETVRLAAEAKDIQIDVNFDSTVSLVSGDSKRLQQVIWNLLSNAVKFTPAGGRVTVTLDQVVEESERSREQETGQPNLSGSSSHSSRRTYARITVSDTGKGIPAKFLPHVFDYFRQADSTTTRRFGGLGLGLAIVYHLVELHGGTVHAESPGEGLGTTITIKIPLMPRLPTKEQVEQLADSAPSLQGLQILVVDDDTDTRDFMVYLLEQMEADVVAVPSANEALQALRQSSPNILLSDIAMPEIDGYTLLRQVRTLPPDQGGQIPAIALTAYAGDLNLRQALQAGFQHHLAKPIEPQELFSAIAALIGRGPHA